MATQDFIKFGMCVLTGSENIINLALDERVYIVTTVLANIFGRAKQCVKWQQQMIIHDRVLRRFPISVGYITPNVV